MNRQYDLILEGGGLGRLIVAWRALKCGRSVLIVDSQREPSVARHLLPGFAGINLKAFEKALAGCDLTAVWPKAKSSQSLLQVVTPSVRYQWWSDDLRSQKEFARASRHHSFPDEIEVIAAEASVYENALSRPERLAPQGFFRSRMGRRVKIAASARLQRFYESSRDTRFWELTAAGLSGGDLPDPAAIAAHGSILQTGLWLTGPLAVELEKKLAEAVRLAGVDQVDGSISRMHHSNQRWTLEVSTQSVDAAAVILGISEPEGFPQSRRQAGELLPCVVVSFTCRSSDLDPSLGPRTVWHRREDPAGEHGPRILWIGREPMTQGEERVVVSFRAPPVAGLKCKADDAHDLIGKLVAMLSPGFDRLARPERYELNLHDSAWLPIDIPYVEKPNLGAGLFRLDRAFAGGFGSTVELAQARDLARWFEKPLRKTNA